MRYLCSTVTLAISLLMLAECLGQEKRPEVKADKEIAALIDKLPEIAEGDVGYMTTMSGSGFLPLGKSESGAFLLGQQAPASSGTMRAIVSRGADAIPILIAHLDDKRETKIKIEYDSAFGGMWFREEYDYNQRTTNVKPVRNDKDPFGGERKTKHTVTVGDLCFVALGQIVNRHFNAVRYQPTAIIVINSPTLSQPLRDRIKKEWGKVTAAQHKESLIQDFKQPDSEYRRTDAVLRLGYYYPEELEPLVVAQLSEPLFDVFEVERLAREKLYPAKNREERKALLADFVAKAGEQSRQGVLDQLFDDLDMQEADEEGNLSPPLEKRHKARECLIELFDYPKEVKSKDKPDLVLTTETSQARFIDSIALFPTPKIDAAVRKVLHATDDDYLAKACVLYLVGRGVDADIRRYVDERLPKADVDRKEELLRMQDRLGWTPLHAAAEKYEEELMDGLVAKGANVNARSASGKTPLHVAADHGSYGGMRVLIKLKADLNAKDKDGKTPIQYGFGYGNSVFDILLEAGAEIPDIYIAAHAGHDELVKKFLEKDKSLATSHSDAGDTALHYAASNGHWKVAELLIAAGADVNARDDERNKLTPLHLAAIYGHHKVVALLLAHKADRTAKDWGNKTPLDHAAEGRDAETIRLLRAP